MYSGMRQERKRIGWSQEFVTEQIGVTPETIHILKLASADALVIMILSEERNRHQTK